MIKITVQLHCYRKYLTTSWNNPAHPSLTSSLFQTLSATRHTLCLLSCFILFVRYIHHPSSARLNRLSLAPLTFVSKLSLMYWCPTVSRSRLNSLLHLSCTLPVVWMGDSSYLHHYIHTQMFFFVFCFYWLLFLFISFTFIPPPFQTLFLLLTLTTNPIVVCKHVWPHLSTCPPPLQTRRCSKLISHVILPICPSYQTPHHCVPVLIRDLNHPHILLM